MTNYYHYTTKRGRDGIVNERCIRASTTLDAGDDARFGEGVYLTTVGPTKGRRQIVTECWGQGAYPAFANDGRVDYVIRVTLPEGKAKKAATQRAVYLYKGDLDLTKYDWKASEVPAKH